MLRYLICFLLVSFVLHNAYAMGKKEEPVKLTPPPSWYPVILEKALDLTFLEFQDAPTQLAQGLGIQPPPASNQTSYYYGGLWLQLAPKKEYLVGSTNGQISGFPIGIYLLPLVMVNGANAEFSLLALTYGGLADVPFQSIILSNSNTTTSLKLMDTSSTTLEYPGLKKPLNFALQRYTYEQVLRMQTLITSSKALLIQSILPNDSVSFQLSVNMYTFKQVMLPYIRLYQGLMKIDPTFRERWSLIPNDLYQELTTRIPPGFEFPGFSSKNQTEAIVIPDAEPQDTNNAVSNTNEVSEEK